MTKLSARRLLTITGALFMTYYSSVICKKGSTWKDDEFFVAAYTDTGRSMKDAAYVQENVTSRRLTCNPPGKPNFDKKDGDECEWKQPNGRSIKLERMQIDENTCELILTKLIVEDGGTYTCMHVRNGGINRPVYERDIVIYDSPVMHVINRRHYSIKDCNVKKINQFVVEMRSWLCIGRPTNCIFNIALKSCEGIVGDNTGRKTAIFEITRYMDKNAPKPICDLDCVKSNYEKMLMDKMYFEGMDTLKANEPVMEEISGFVPLLDRNAEVLGAWCREGFFVYKDLVCMPCAAGYYRTKAMAMTACSECGYFKYQPKIASTSCISCPWLGFSNVKNKISVLSCVPMYMTWQFMTVVSLIPVTIVILVATGSLTKCFNKILGSTTKKTFERDKRLSKETVFKKIATHESGGTSTPAPTRTAPGAVSPAVMAGMPRELTQMRTLSARDVAFLKRDMANMRNFSLTYDPRSTGFSHGYRKQQKQKFRVDDEELPEAIQKRQHSALGWTDKYDTSSYYQPTRSYARN